MEIRLHGQLVIEVEMAVQISSRVRNAVIAHHGCDPKYRE